MFQRAGATAEENFLLGPATQNNRTGGTCCVFLSCGILLEILQSVRLCVLIMYINNIKCLAINWLLEDSSTEGEDGLVLLLPLCTGGIELDIRIMYQ